MTPKEKAKELVDRFKEKSKDQIFYDWDYVHKYNALICVDEIISLNYQVKKEIEHKFNMNLWIKDWQEVKQEIFKL